MSNEHQKPHEVFRDNPQPAICLILNEDQVPRIRGLLVSDCFVRVQFGCTIRQLLCDQFFMNPEYVEKEITVVFLNFQPVDDIDNARIKDGSILALSAGMPGLVGAAMRKDGLACMRSGITYRELGSHAMHGDGIIQLKLFNRVMADWGGHVLTRGVYLKRAILAEYLAALPEEFWQGCKHIMLKGERVSKGALLDTLWSTEGWVYLTINVDQEETPHEVLQT
jgi:hypothetical protein